MTKELFCEILGDVQEEFIMEAWKDASESPKAEENFFQVREWRLRLGVMAAALVMLVGGGMLYQKLHVENKTGLPILTITGLQTDGMGFEGLMYRNAEELISAKCNPLKQQTLPSALPVYRNLNFSLNQNGVPVGADVDAMVQRLQRAAAALGVDADNWKTTRQSGEVYDVSVETESVRIVSDVYGSVAISFKGGVELPAQYHFTQEETTEEKAQEIMAYLVKRYGDLLGFAEPAMALEGDRDIYGNFHRTYKVYDAAGDEAEWLLHYCFQDVHFGANDDGKLSVIRLNDQLATAEKIGDYPIITEEEARQKLLAGKYLTTVPYQMPGEDAVVMAELVYRTSHWEENYLPYYRFYAELPDDIFEAGVLPDDLNIYGAYYVPAVADDYLSVVDQSQMGVNGGMRFQ